MHTRLKQTAGDKLPQPSVLSQSSAPVFTRRTLPSDVLLLVGLMIVALLPRILLARQLDVVTDEVVYILGGKIYLPLITHANIGSDKWSQFNYEHPPLAKILIGLSIAFNTLIGQPFNELMAGRFPSIIMGTILVAAVYWLGRAPFGRTIALIAALSLAVSPWLVYFSALAYLDMTMTAFITIAFLTLWHALRRPWLYPVLALLVGLGAASKYTAVLVIPGIVLFIVYYFFLLRPTMPIEKRPALPWLWWLLAIIIAPLAFFIADPAIWLNPIGRIIHSFTFEWNHSANGHPTFIAGQYYTHVPRWSIIFIVFTKMSAFLTIPAALFVLVALIQLVRFHLRKGQIDSEKAASYAYIVIWLLSILGMFSLLNIVVGTHYHLPLAPPVAVAGVAGLTLIVRFIANFFAKKKSETSEETPIANNSYKPGVIIPVIILALLAIGPHLLGLSTVYAAEGYTNEFAQNDENTTLQVAYPGYREALQWLASADHSQGKPNVGLISLPGTLNGYSPAANWFHYNTDMVKRFQLTEAHPKDSDYTRYAYLVWPKHLVQRGYPLPAQAHIVHEIMGGNTIYCYILAIDKK